MVFEVNYFQDKNITNEDTYHNILGNYFAFPSKAQLEYIFLRERTYYMNS